MFTKINADCPVCEARLGYRIRGEVCSFVCQECRWIFTWDSNAKLLTPVKFNPKKRDICDCGGCQARDENRYYKGRE